MQHPTPRTPVHSGIECDASTRPCEPEIPARPQSLEDETCAALAGLLAEFKAELLQPTKQQLGSPHLSLKEAAIYLGITTDTLTRKIHGCDIPVHRRPGMHPYFLKHEIDRWLEDPATLAQTQEEDEEDGDSNSACEIDVIKDLLEEADPPGEDMVLDHVL